MCHVSAGRCIRSNLFSPPARVRSRLETFVLLVCLPGHVNTPHRFLNRGGWSFMCACVRKNCARIEFDLGRVPVPPHTHTYTRRNNPFDASRYFCTAHSVAVWWCTPAWRPRSASPNGHKCALTHARMLCVPPGQLFESFQACVREWAE